MPLVATPHRRRLVMAFLLLLAVGGAVMRWLAPPDSVLHDVGTLLLVMWVPAVGNLVAWLFGKLPKRAARVTDFAAGTPFVAHLQARLAPTELAPGALAGMRRDERRCTLLLGQQAFTARLDVPLVDALAGTPTQVAVQLLRPEAALPSLRAGSAFHVLVGTRAAGQGTVVG